MIVRLVSYAFVVALLLSGATGCSALFPTKADASLQHFAIEAPNIGDALPDVEVVNLQGETVHLSERIRDRSVVLQFGSYTCPVFRYRRFSMTTVIEKYRDRVDFLVVYTQEAHPVGSPSPYPVEEWVPWLNKLTRIQTRQPDTLLERLNQATSTKKALEYSPEFFVDGMSNSAWRSYGRAPSPAFLIDRHRRILLRQVWVEPVELSEEIDRLLSESPQAN